MDKTEKHPITTAMNLLPNSPIKMDYSPATDILSVEYPDLDASLLPLVKDSLLVMAKAIRNYDIKRLLLDVSRTTVSVSEEESRAMSMLLAAELAKTRLQRLARVQTPDHARERAAQANISQIRQTGMLPYQLQTFATKAEALEWLQANS